MVEGFAYFGNDFGTCMAYTEQVNKMTAMLCAGINAACETNQEIKSTAHNL